VDGVAVALDGDGHGEQPPELQGFPEGTGRVFGDPVQVVGHPEQFLPPGWLLGRRQLAGQGGVAAGVGHDAVQADELGLIELPLGQVGRIAGIERVQTLLHPGLQALPALLEDQFVAGRGVPHAAEEVVAEQIDALAVGTRALERGFGHEGLGQVVDGFVFPEILEAAQLPLGLLADEEAVACALLKGLGLHFVDQPRVGELGKDRRAPGRRGHVAGDELVGADLDGDVLQHVAETFRATDTVGFVFVLLEFFRPEQGALGRNGQGRVQEEFAPGIDPRERRGVFFQSGGTGPVVLGDGIEPFKDGSLRVFRCDALIHANLLCPMRFCRLRRVLLCAGLPRLPLGRIATM